MNVKFGSTLLAVTDMQKSLDFYKKFFDQDVETDLGWNKVLTCGLTLQEHFDQIAGFPLESMIYKNHAMEVYFEAEDFDAFMNLIDNSPEIERVHDQITFPWLQRGIRFYDPDHHVIEVGETMQCVVRRLFDEGKDVEEVAKMVMFPIETVEIWYKEYQENKEYKESQV